MTAATNTDSIAVLLLSFSAFFIVAVCRRASERRDNGQAPAEMSGNQSRTPKRFTRGPFWR
jgi:hypothetical protein